jgi:HK97 family phage prohead protease
MTMWGKTHGAPVLEVKAEGSSGEVAGLASTFGGEPDSYGDIVAPGAFKDSLEAHAAAGTMPKMFWQHDAHEPIGRWLRAEETDAGLWMEGRLNMGVRRAAEAFELLKAGDIDGLSIGYRLEAYEVDEDVPGVWTLTRIDLREVSVVSLPANEAAGVASVKAARDAAAITEKLKAGDRLTEREFEQLLKGALGLSNSQAERAARVHLKGQGDPAVHAAKDDGLAFLRALRS